MNCTIINKPIGLITRTVTKSRKVVYTIDTSVYRAPSIECVTNSINLVDACPIAKEISELIETEQANQKAAMNEDRLSVVSEGYYVRLKQLRLSLVAANTKCE